MKYEIEIAGSSFILNANKSQRKHVTGLVKFWRAKFVYVRGFPGFYVRIGTVYVSCLNTERRVHYNIKRYSHTNPNRKEMKLIYRK